MTVFPSCYKALYLLFCFLPFVLSRTILNRNGDSVYPSLVPNFRGKVFDVLLFNTIFAIDIWRIT